jgi:hypothetical protein
MDGLLRSRHPVTRDELASINQIPILGSLANDHRPDADVGAFGTHLRTLNRVIT